MRSYWKIKLWAKFVNHFDVFDNLWSSKIAVWPQHMALDMEILCTVLVACGLFTLIGQNFKNHRKFQGLLGFYALQTSIILGEFRRGKYWLVTRKPAVDLEQKSSEPGDLEKVTCTWLEFLWQHANPSLLSQVRNSSHLNCWLESSAKRLIQSDWSTEETNLTGRDLNLSGFYSSVFRIVQNEAKVSLTDQWNPKYPYNLVYVSTQYSLKFSWFMPADLIACIGFVEESSWCLFSFSIWPILHQTDAKSSEPKGQMSTPNITGTKNRNWPRQKLYMDPIHGVFLQNLKSIWIFFWDQRLVQLSQDRGR